MICSIWYADVKSFPNGIVFPVYGERYFCSNQALYLIISDLLGCAFFEILLTKSKSLSFLSKLSIDNVNCINFTLYHLLSGGLIFGAVFMVTDPVTSPITKPGRVIFGTLVACISLLIRFIGAYPEGVAFAILICNMS